MRVLVTGSARVDAGKTTYSLGLMHTHGMPGFKPRAGSDYWYHHTTYQTATSEGRLYGRDARRLADATPGPHQVETINPLHRLWRPTPAADDFIGPPDRQFLLDRLGQNDYIVNANTDLPRSAHETLPLTAATRVHTIEDLNRVTEQRYLPALAALVEHINMTDAAVIESYGSIARPCTGLDLDYAVVVEPGRARVYAGPRWLKACDVVGGSAFEGRREQRVSDVTALLEPVATVDLPPLASDELASLERIADAYATAYDHLG